MEIALASGTDWSTQIRYHLCHNLQLCVVLRVQDSEGPVIPVHLDRKIMPYAGRERLRE